MSAAEVSAMSLWSQGVMRTALPVRGDIFPRSRVWLCGSTVDNKRYSYEYAIECIAE